MVQGACWVVSTVLGAGLIWLNKPGFLFSSSLKVMVFWVERGRHWGLYPSAGGMSRTVSSWRPGHQPMPLKTGPCLSPSANVGWGNPGHGAALPLLMQLWPRQSASQASSRQRWKQGSSLSASGGAGIREVWPSS